MKDKTTFGHLDREIERLNQKSLRRTRRFLERVNQGTEKFPRDMSATKREDLVDGAKRSLGWGR